MWNQVAQSPETPPATAAGRKRSREASEAADGPSSPRPIKRERRDSESPRPIKREPDDSPPLIKWELKGGSPYPFGWKCHIESSRPIKWESDSESPCPINWERDSESPCPIKRESDSESPCPIKWERYIESPCSIDLEPESPRPIMWEPGSDDEKEADALAGSPRTPSEAGSDARHNLPTPFFKTEEDEDDYMSGYLRSGPPRAADAAADWRDHDRPEGEEEPWEVRLFLALARWRPEHHEAAVEMPAGDPVLDDGVDSGYCSGTEDE